MSDDEGPSDEAEEFEKSRKGGCMKEKKGKKGDGEESAEESVELAQEDESEGPSEDEGEEKSRKGGCMKEKKGKKDDGEESAEESE